MLEGEHPSQTQISGRLKHVSLMNFPVFSAIHHSLNSDQFSSNLQMKNIPTAWWWQHHAEGMFFIGRLLETWSELCVLGVMRGVGFAPDITFSLMANKLHFSLI
jgi:hypothetical protein